MCSSKTEKIAYIDVDVTIRVRVPFNGAADEQMILDDINATECDDYDGVEIYRIDFDKEHGEKTCEPTEYLRCIGIQTMTVVGRGELTNK